MAAAPLCLDLLKEAAQLDSGVPFKLASDAERPMSVSVRAYYGLLAR